MYCLLHGNTWCSCPPTIDWWSPEARARIQEETNKKFDTPEGRRAIAAITETLAKRDLAEALFGWLRAEEEERVLRSLWS